MLKAFIDYLRYELNRAPLTVEAYSTDIRQFMEWLSPKDPDATDFYTVTSSDIRAWLSTLARKGESPRTLRRKTISLRNLFHWMRKKGYISSSPMRSLPLPKIPRPLPDLIKPREIESAIETAADEAQHDTDAAMKELIIDMLYSLGIRRAELMGIDDKDISFPNGELKVTGKRSKQRVIPVPQRLLDKIRTWQKLRDENYESVSSDSPLFIVKGKRIAPHQIYGIVKQALSETSAKKKSPHALRHSFASAMLNGGAEIDSVREFLGHSSLSTTQIYTHISLNEIKKAYSTAHPRAASDKEKK